MRTRTKRAVGIVIGTGVFTALAPGLGCGKEINPEFCLAYPTDNRCTANDAMPDTTVDSPPGVFDVAHLAPDVEVLLDGSGSLMLSGMIDTSSVPTFPGAKVLADVSQQAGSPSVMVIQAGSITITGALKVTGNKPLVLVAKTTIAVNANIDVSADHSTNGPGGYGPALGPGAGSPGVRTTSRSDCGGAGGSFGAQGGRGGRCETMDPGPNTGQVFGSMLKLEGGAGGGSGNGNACKPAGGGGGGALQLTAGESITIASGTSIDAGGGGGGRGLGSSGTPSCNNDGASAGGGGAGGMIYLQAPVLLGTGRLGANGGGGGGGASTGGGTPGVDGIDANPTTGGNAGNGSNNGGSGASTASAAGTGEGSTSQDENGGGGGGGMGWIFFHSASSPGYPTSPTSTRVN